jgi:peptide/nickel transport system permease protein
MKRTPAQTLLRWGGTLIALAVVYVGFVYLEAGIEAKSGIGRESLARPWTMEGELWTTVVIRFVASLKLYGVVFAAVVGFGVPLGVFVGGMRLAWMRRVGGFLFLLVIAVPTVGIALAAMCYTVGWLEVPVLRPVTVEMGEGGGGVVSRLLGDLWFTILPAMVLAVPGIGKVALDVRVAVAQSMRCESMIALTSRGLSRSRRLYRYALPASWWASLRGIADVLPKVVGASMIVEQVFDYPGLGARCFEAVVEGDFRLLVLLAMILALLVLVGRMLLEFLEAVIFREGGASS